MDSEKRERFRTLSAEANIAEGTKFLVSEDDWLMLREKIIEQLESQGKPPIPFADADGDMLFRGKGLVINGLR